MRLPEGIGRTPKLTVACLKSAGGNNVGSSRHDWTEGGH